MHLSDFDFNLPEKLIAQEPVSPRHNSRLLVVRKKTETLREDIFKNIADHLKPGDLLVFNDSYVFPARLHGKKESGKDIEVLLLKKESENQWKCILTPGVKNTQTITFSETLSATVEDTSYEEKERLLTFNKTGDELWHEIFLIGEMPVPPYIAPNKNDHKNYQTVYANSSKKGSAAAPTAGLHFTDTVFNALKKRGIETAFCTLHVGLGTFQPVYEEDITKHEMHAEHYRIEETELEKITSAKKQGRRIIAVGTTSARVLETLFSTNRTKTEGSTNIYIYPGYEFKAIDGLITNFHLPKSSLLMLVSALAGTKLIQKAYQKAIKEKYRFYSYGDAMLIT